LLTFLIGTMNDENWSFMYKAIKLSWKSSVVKDAYCVGCIFRPVVQYRDKNFLENLNREVLPIFYGYSRELEGNTHAEECAIMKFVSFFKLSEEVEIPSVVYEPEICKTEFTKKKVSEFPTKLEFVTHRFSESQKKTLITKLRNKEILYDVYVTMEPCSFRLSDKQTCTFWLTKIKNYISCVYVGCFEPTTLVSDCKGAYQLSQLEKIPLKFFSKVGFVEDLTNFAKVKVDFASTLRFQEENFLDLQQLCLLPNIHVVNSTDYRISPAQLVFQCSQKIILVKKLLHNLGNAEKLREIIQYITLTEVSGNQEALNNFNVELFIIEKVLSEKALKNSKSSECYEHSIGGISIFKKNLKGMYKLYFYHLSDKVDKDMAVRDLKRLEKML
jgi:pyrimidine deaminase RibD-like protein